MCMISESLIALVRMTRALVARNSALDLWRCSGQSDVLAGPAPGDAAHERNQPVSLRFAGTVTAHWGRPNKGTRGDVMPVGNRTALVGMGERSSPQGIGQLAESLFAEEVADRVLAFCIPNSRSAMHLDTIFTLCGGDVVKTFKEVADELVCYDIRPGESATPISFRHDPRPIFDIVAEVLGYGKLQIVPTGGITEEERAREQRRAEGVR